MSATAGMPSPHEMPPVAEESASPGLVSVVIPTYNRATIVGRAIDSVLAQSYRPVEVVVVDDGSTDDSRRIVEAYGEPVRYLFQPNSGVCLARNVGLEAAHGEFVGLLDSDDVWLPWKLGAQVRFLRRFPEAGMVWTDMAAVDTAGSTVDPAYLRTYYGAYRKTRLDQWLRPVGPLGGIDPTVPTELAGRTMWLGDLFSAMLFGNMVHTSTVLLRRDCQRRVGGFDESLGRTGEDYDFHWRVCREGPVGFLDASSILYEVQSSDQLSGPKYHVEVARACLRTVERRVAEDRLRLQVPPAAIRRQMASTHRWLGEELLLAGRRSESTRHLAGSLAANPLQPRMAALLLASLLPDPVFMAVRAVKHALTDPRSGRRQEVK